MSGMQLGDKKLVVQRASVGAKNPIIDQAMGIIPQVPIGMGAPTLPINIPGLIVQPTSQNVSEILCLMNMVTTEELEDDEEFESELGRKGLGYKSVSRGWRA